MLSEWSIYALVLEKCGLLLSAAGSVRSGRCAAAAGARDPGTPGQARVFRAGTRRNGKPVCAARRARSVRSRTCSEGLTKQRPRTSRPRGGAPGRQPRQRRTSICGRWDEAERHNQEAQATLDGQSSCAVRLSPVEQRADRAWAASRFDEAARTVRPGARGARRAAVRAVGRAFQPGERGARAEAAGARRRGIRSGAVGHRNDARRSAADRRQSRVPDQADHVLSGVRVRADRTGTRPIARSRSPTRAAVSCSPSARGRRRPAVSKRRPFSASPANRVRSCCRTGSRRSSRGSG